MFPLTVASTSTSVTTVTVTATSTFASTPSASANPDTQHFSYAIDDLKQSAIQKLEPSSAYMEEREGMGEMIQIINHIQVVLKQAPDEEKSDVKIGVLRALLEEAVEFSSILEALGDLFANASSFDFDTCEANKKCFNISYKNLTSQLNELLKIYGAVYYFQEGSPLKLIDKNLKVIFYSFLDIHRTITNHRERQEESNALEESITSHADLNEAQTILAKLLKGLDDSRPIYLHQINLQQKQQIPRRIANAAPVTTDLSKMALAEPNTSQPVKQKINRRKIRSGSAFRNPPACLNYGDSDSSA